MSFFAAKPSLGVQLQMSSSVSLEDTAKTLKNSPLYQMSLGAKELFHSNFIAWLFETYPCAAKPTIGLEISHKNRIVREKKNIDIVIENANGYDVAIIENKFKDAPNKKQLETYREKSKSEKFESYPDCILLTLVPATFDLECLQWQQITYQQFVEKLRSWLAKPPCKGTKSDRVIIEAYCEMVEGVCIIAKQFLEVKASEDNYWFGERDLKLLEEIRFSDTIKKYDVNRLARDVIEKLPSNLYTMDPQKKLEDGETSIHVSARLFNKAPCLSVSTNHQLGKNTLHLNIEIQGTQYRRMLGFKPFHFPGKRDDARKEIDLAGYVEKTDGYKWLFGKKSDGKYFFINLGEVSKRRYKTSMNKALNSYAPDAIYQYINISKTKTSAEKLGYGEVLNCIEQDVKYALELVGDKSYLEKFKEFKK